MADSVRDLKSFGRALQMVGALSHQPLPAHLRPALANPLGPHSVQSEALKMVLSTVFTRLKEEERLPAFERAAQLVEHVPEHRRLALIGILAQMIGAFTETEPAERLLRLAELCHPGTRTQAWVQAMRQIHHPNPAQQRQGIDQYTALFEAQQLGERTCDQVAYLERMVPMLDWTVGSELVTPAVHRMVLQLPAEQVSASLLRMGARYIYTATDRSASFARLRELYAGAEPNETRLDALVPALFYLDHQEREGGSELYGALVGMLDAAQGLSGSLERVRMFHSLLREGAGTLAGDQRANLFDKVIGLLRDQPPPGVGELDGVVEALGALRNRFIPALPEGRQAQAGVNLALIVSNWSVPMMSS